MKKNLLARMIAIGLSVLMLPGIAFTTPTAIVQAANPYLPLWEHIPDGEPRVFEDPENPGNYRAYIYGSHDVRNGSYCGPDVRCWSAPVDDLNNWRDEGPIFTYNINNQWDVMYAPDIVEVNRFAPGTTRTAASVRTVREYYLYPNNQGSGRAAQVCKGPTPVGPFTAVNMNAAGTGTLSGSVIGFDPAVWVDYVDDPADPDYNIGFRAYAYWGYQRSYAAELDQETMYSRRSGGAYYDYFLPSSSSYGNLRDPAGTVYPCIFPGEDLTRFNFFEASSIRKVGNKYVSIYSGYSGPDYGPGSTNSALRYCYGDTPLGPWKSGGVLVDSRAPVLNEAGTNVTTSAWGHNTHGSICEINGQWYVYYHRAPRGFGYMRQPMVAPLKITWDETAVADGGTLVIRAYDPNSADNTWTAKASNGNEYTGAEVTSEGFEIFGLDPYKYLSVGYACYVTGTATMQDSWDIWDSHMSITGVQNNSIVGFKYFGFGGLASDQKGLKAFEGTKPGNNTTFNLFLKPNTTNAFTVQIWMDGPWNNAVWGGTQIGEISIPANSPQEIIQVPVSVSNYVDNLGGKHAIYLKASGGSGSLCDYIGVGFSSDTKAITRPISPTTGIMIDGKAIDLPAAPVRSTNQNGIVGYNNYSATYATPEGQRTIPVITASASDESVKITVKQATSFTDTAVVDFDYKGVVKTYTIQIQPPPAASITGIDVGGVSLSGFSAATTSYLYYVPENTTGVPQVTVNYDHDLMDVTVVQATSVPGVATVTADNGVTVVVYTVNLKIAAPPVSDNFIGGEKNTVWTIINPDNDNWSLDKGFGLRLPTLTEDIHNNTSDFYNLFVQPADSDWEVIAKAYYPVMQSANYQQSALVVWGGPGNFVKLDCENTGANRRVQFGTMTNGSFASTTVPSSGGLAAAADGSLTIYYRIRKVGNSYTGSYSLDGVSYTSVGSARTLAIQDPQIGLFATKNQASAPVIETYFEYLSVLSANGQQLLTVDQMLQNAVEKAADAAADLIQKTVNSDLNLKLLPFSYSITGTSGKQEFISDTGQVTQPLTVNAEVPFTITVTNGTKSASRTVRITVEGKQYLNVSATKNERDGLLSVVADVYSGTSSIDANLITAVYDRSGRLATISTEKIVADEKTQEILVSNIDVSKLGSDYSVKVFLWDQNMVPLFTAVEPATTRDVLVNKTPETYCNPINISYRYQVDESTGWYRALADMQPVYYKGEYWLFPTCASGYFYSNDLINWEFVYSDAPQIDTYAPGAFVLNDYLYVGRFNGNIYRSNNPKDGGSWQAVRASNTNYPDPYYYLDPDTGRLFVLHGCAGLTNNNMNTTPAVRILELDTTSPTLAALPVDTSVSGATSAGYPVFYMRRNLRGYEVPGQLNDNYATTAQSWLEGPGMIKHDGKYYMYYTGPGSEYAGYCDACYVADDPLGPYTWCDNSPFAYKSTGFTVGTGHGHHVEEQISGRIWKFGTIAISNRHIFERRASLYPVDYNSLGQPITDLVLGDYPMYVPTSSKSSFENQGPGWNLISYGAKVTASSTYDVDVTPVGATKMAPFHISAEKAFDESIRTWWSAETGNPGEWLMGDLGRVCTVNAVQLNFADQDARRLSTSQPAARAYDGCYRYLLEYSLDGENWITIADRSDYTAEPYKAQDYSHDYYELVKGIPMRYVRVTNHGPTPAEGKFAISDLRLFGDGGGTAPAEVESFTLSGVEGRDKRSVQVSWNPVNTAEGYIIRFGVHPDELNLHHQVIGRTSEIINILSTYTDTTLTTPVEYYFRIDTYNDSGYTVGTKTVKLN